ncbi:MAG: M16 family metallopeptidase [Gemmatimonadaceae bacterium]
MKRSDHLRARTTARSAGILALITLALSATAAPARTATSSADQPVGNLPAHVAPLTDSLPRDSAVAMGTLPNGLRYYVRSNRTPAGRAELRLVVNAGSLVEDEDQRGLAHFMEHMAFNGTRNFEGHELINFLQSVGMSFGADLNAYTSYDETVYMLTVPTDSGDALGQGVQILEDWAHGITIDSAEVVAERGVVLEEWRARGFSDKRSNEMRQRMDSVIYNGSLYAYRSPIGDPERLKTANRAEILRFYEDWYRPDMMAVVAVGDFDRDSMVAEIRRHFAGIEQPASPRPHPRPTIPDNAETMVNVVPLRGAGTIIRMMMKEPAREQGTVAAFRAALIDRFYLSMLNRRFQEVVRRPDSPFLSAGGSKGQMAEGRVQTYELQVVGRRASVRSGFAAMLAEVERVAQHGFTAAEVERETAALMREMESAAAASATIESAAYAQGYVAHRLTPGTQLLSHQQSLALVSRLLPTITAAELAAPAVRWRDQRNRVITGQIPGVTRGVTAEALLAVADSVAGLTLEPYEGSVKVRPLIASAPVAGSIVGERTIDGLDVTEWTLSNGARVLLKPTPFHADQVVVRGYSAGGLSLVDDDSYVSALSAASVVRASGLGDLSADEVADALRTKVIRRYGASIGANSEEVMVDGSPRDLEGMFELLYLQVTAPRVDTAAFEKWKDAARPQYARGNAGLNDFLERYMTLQHPRLRPTTYAMVDSVELDVAFDFYRERFQNAADFTYVVVGAFTPEQVRPLVERYVASLPSKGTHEEARDLQIRPPRGVLEETVNVSSEAKAMTYVNFSGPLDFSLESQSQLSALAGVLTIRLRERLREELGGTYGVSVGPSAQRAPYGQYSIAIQFGSAPERAEELGEALFQVLDSLKANGPTELELREVIEMERRQRQRAMQANDYWLATLVEAQERQLPIADLVSMAATERAVTAAAVQAAARLYLDERNYVHLTFMPRTDQGFDYGRDTP